MRKPNLKILFVTVALVAGTGVDSIAQEKTYPANGKLKIFILAGQSNMVGHGELKGGTGTIKWYLKEKSDKYDHLVKDNGEHVVRDDVWILNLPNPDKNRQAG